MRFIQTCATPYILTTATQDSGTLCIQQSQGSTTGSLAFNSNTGANAIPPVANVNAGSVVGTGLIAGFD
jgi:hypothetical protein